jgi:hypothetical protein
LGVIDMNNCPAAGAARILDQPYGSPTADPDKAEVNWFGRQRRVALEATPFGRLPRDGCQQAHVAGDFHFGGVIHAHFNRASSVPATAG